MYGFLRNNRKYIKADKYREQEKMTHIKSERIILASNEIVRTANVCIK